jgi:hypothetical protein
MKVFANMTGKVKNFVDQRLPERSDEEITEPFEAFGAVATCSGCEVAFKKAQDLFLDEFAQQFVINVCEDACYLIQSVLTLEACRLYIE